MTIEKMDFMLVGVGGQGTLLASDILAGLGLLLGLEVKKAEVHGMAQRGGSVTSYVRWGNPVLSPIVARGEVDFLVAFEKLEGVRYLDHLRPGGSLLVNDQVIEPITVKTGGLKYPTSTAIDSAFLRLTSQVHHVDGQALALKAGNEKTVNVCILGALSALMEAPLETWLEAVRAHVPERFAVVNHQAFILGRQCIPGSD